MKEAGIEVTDENREKIDEIIHQYISEQASYGRCSADWRKARKEIQANEQMKREPIESFDPQHNTSLFFNYANES